MNFRARTGLSEFTPASPSTSSPVEMPKRPSPTTSGEAEARKTHDLPNRPYSMMTMMTPSPNTKQFTLSKVWRQLKEYFDSDDATVYEALQDLMDVRNFVDSFRNAPYLETEPTASADPLQPGVCALKTSQRSRSGSSGGTGSSNSNNLSPVAITKMKEEFGKHFDAFRGESWKLASGTIVDQVIAAHVTTLSYESTLHSFIIENPNVILELFSVEADKDELKKVLMVRAGEEMAKLSTEELRYLGLYDKPPREVDKLLAGGWVNMPTSTEGPILDDEFRKITHCCLQHIHLIYSQGNFSLPRDQAESWFMDKLWGFLNVIFDSEERLEHQPGEVSSQASALRKSRIRTLDERQLPGRKTDGLVSSAVTRLEICTIEAAKKDNGASSTEALSDTRKMAKNMKDMSDLHHKNNLISGGISSGIQEGDVKDGRSDH
ncbi:hypothetical protein BGX34_007561 [Mortierella sp. NVP85]|nr:hypothetical protein BGX34_007561 [Mortierella sp. NVP85]